MSEREERPHHPHHPSQHRRNVHPNRGRPPPNRLYHDLGITDLRELINQRRTERGTTSEGHVPPPDPSYSYLKDPLRENPEQAAPPSRNPPGKFQKKHPSTSKKADNLDIENPLNIKVEFSTTTGEHVYKLDKETVLPTIKHVPDQQPPQSRSFRGRGRGRGRSFRKYPSRTVENKRIEGEVVESAPENSKLSPEKPIEDNTLQVSIQNLKINENEEVKESTTDSKQEEANNVETK